jgi:ATP-dependent DNA helicase RecG
LNHNIQSLKGVGPRKAALLRRLGISTVRDAIFYFPTRYEDRGTIRKISDLVPGALQTIVGKVTSANLKSLGRRRMKLFELSVSDSSGTIKGVWFNQPFMKDRFKVGQSVTLSGTVKQSRWGIGMDNPECEIGVPEEGEFIHTARVVPVYGATEGLSSKQLRNIISTALKIYQSGLEDALPKEILKKHGFPGLRESVTFTHFPPEKEDIDSLNGWRTPSQQRLSFDELFMLETGFAILKKDKLKEKGISFKSEGGLLDKLLRSLPFELTQSQKRVFFDEILPDMKTPHSMSRLLQGDVGSGKTIVALMALLTAVECGFQTAIMAPTEILAEQHYMNIHSMVEGLGLRCGLLTGSVKKKPLKEIEEGSMDVVIGTHAIIQEGVRFKSLGLAVVDEQHRFGVMQRATLRKKALSPDVLIMTATPIPRTLALTLYGDLDYSVMRELPPGRTPVMTSMFTPDRKKDVYQAIASEVSDGGQVYVVYPVIEESEKTDLRSAVVGEEAMKKVFPELRIALIHGRMRPEDKESVMARFKTGDIDILVSTTVIEVGVDVPNASLMVIVHAERFGLSQLHQLRGRVGRGRKKSRCMLLAYGPLGDDAQKRLGVMCRTSDGFKIAEEDLMIRGPGELLGTRQSGLPEMKVANIMRDAELIEVARKEAFSLVGKDPELQGHLRLRAALEGFWHGKVELFKTG